MSKQEVIKLIIDVSQNSDVDTEYLLTMANIESGFNPDARNKYSGAAGLYQFMPSTAKAYGLRNPYNPNQAIVATIKLTRANAAILDRAGIDVTGTSLYLAHQQGAGGVLALYKSIRTGMELPNNIRRNINANGGKGMTAKEFIEFWRRKYLQKVLETRNILEQLGIYLDS